MTNVGGGGGRCTAAATKQARDERYGTREAIELMSIESKLPRRRRSRP